MWRWIDDDASGSISSGEFLRLMRKGWDGYLEEKRKMEAQKSLDLLRRPNWVSTATVKGSAWPEVTTTVKERRKHALDAASKEIEGRAQRYRASAKRLALSGDQWLETLQGIEVAEQAKRQSKAALEAMLSEQGMSTKRPNSRPAMGASYSTPTLATTGFKG